MKAAAYTCQRVLAIAPSKRGFGFAVLEGPNELIDWGTREAKREKNTKCLRQIAFLIERYSPDVVVIENHRDRSCRRSARIRELLEGIAALAFSKRAKLRRIPRSALKKVFSQFCATGKHQLAIEISKRFPELAAHVPPPRKPWMTQVARMSMFDAVAIALTFESGN